MMPPSSPAIPPAPPPAPPRPDTGLEPPSVGDAHEVPWRWWQALLVYFIGFLVLGSIVAVIVLLIMGGDLSAGTGLGFSGLVASAIADVVFLGTLIGWLRTRTPAWRQAVRLPEGGRRLRSLGVGLGMGLLLYPVVAIGVGTVLVIVFRAATGDTVAAPEQLSADLSVDARVLAGIFAIMVAPVIEELFFRGVLFRSLRRHGFWAAAIVSSLVFGLVHYVGGPAPSALFLMVATAFTGLGLAVIYEWRGLAASIGAHMAFNAIGLALIFTVA